MSDSPAAEAGLRPHDRIVAVDDTPVQTWGQLAELLDISHPAVHQLRIERNSEQFEVSLEGSSTMGLEFLRPAPIVGVDNPRSPAALAGLQTGDEIVEVDGTSVRDFYDLQAALQTGQTHSLTVNRDGTSLSLSIQDRDWSPEHTLESWYGSTSF